mmetsp:Transcript_14035/g.31775  ORF Transcript_14035/g.31775 Transcript_14035/m.31775 type:complete len:203 (-) Transcript_14035:1097-1705(-)
MRRTPCGVTMCGRAPCCAGIGTRRSGRVASSSRTITSTGCCGPSEGCCLRCLHGRRSTITIFWVSPRMQAMVKSSVHTGKNAWCCTLIRVVTSRSSKSCRTLMLLFVRSEKLPRHLGRRSPRRPRRRHRQQRTQHRRVISRSRSSMRVGKPLPSLLVLSRLLVMLQRRKWRQRWRLKLSTQLCWTKLGVCMSIYSPAYQHSQ